MPLVNGIALLKDAQKHHYAVGAFNVENMEMVMAVVKAAEEMNSPVILQTTPSTIQYANSDYFYANVKVAAQHTNVPIALHLDHGDSTKLVLQAFRSGYTSIMIDGSKKSLEDNISLTKSVVEICHSVNVSVEAELGKVGGKEDALGCDEVLYTDPLEAQKFVERTQVDSLAVAIGSAHGIYKGIPKIDIQRLNKIKQVVEIPLVLHGTSGIPDDIVQNCIQEGICKVNYATDLRIAYTKGIKCYLENNPNAFDPKKYNMAGMIEVYNYVKSKMIVCGCVEKATHFLF